MQNKNGRNGTKGKQSDEPRGKKEEDVSTRVRRKHLGKAQLFVEKGTHPCRVTCTRGASGRRAWGRGIAREGVVGTSSSLSLPKLERCFLFRPPHTRASRTCRHLFKLPSWDDTPRSERTEPRARSFRSLTRDIDGPRNSNTNASSFTYAERQMLKSGSQTV